MTDQLEIGQFLDDLNAGVTTHWQARTALCLCLNAGFSWIYRNPPMLTSWRKATQNGYDARVLSRIYPACTLTTAALANTADLMMSFLESYPATLSQVKTVMLSSVRRSHKEAMKAYTEYLAEKVNKVESLN